METDVQCEGELQNGNYYLALLKAEAARLKALVFSAELELEENETIPEEVRGKMRVAAGKAKMLLRKKFIQFEKLCLKNLGTDSDIRYPVNCEDLAGYWDTTVIQMLQVYNIFEEIDILRKNNWEKPVKKVETLPAIQKSINKETKRNSEMKKVM